MSEAPAPTAGIVVVVLLAALVLGLIGAVVNPILTSVAMILILAGICNRRGER